MWTEYYSFARGSWYVTRYGQPDVFHGLDHESARALVRRLNYLEARP